MTENERKLLEIIRENDDPESLLIAVDVILKHLTQLGSFEGQAPAAHLVPF